MDQLQSAKSALQRALAEVEAAIAALSTGDNGASRDYSESLAISESSDELSDGQCQHRPSKASVHVDQEEAPDYGEFDPRFQQDTWVRPKPPGGSSFSIELLWCAAAAGQYGDGEEFPIFILRHRNAARCPSGIRCASSHWELIADDLPAREKGCIELQLVCLSTRHVELQMSSMNNGYFYDDRDLITIPPCRLHNDLLPDFSSVRAAGYQVVLFRLIESWEDKRLTGVVDGGVWMDNHGRLLFDMYRQCGNTGEMHSGDPHTEL